MAKRKRRRRAAPKTRIVYRYRNKPRRRRKKRRKAYRAARKRPTRRRRTRRNPPNKITKRNVINVAKQIAAGGLGVSAGWLLANYATSTFAAIPDDFDASSDEEVKKQQFKEDAVRIGTGLLCGIASLYVKNQYAKIALLGAGFGCVARVVHPKVVAYLEDPENKVAPETVDKLTAASALGQARLTPAQQQLYALQTRAGFAGVQPDSFAGQQSDAMIPFAGQQPDSMGDCQAAFGVPVEQRRTRGAAF